MLYIVYAESAHYAGYGQHWVVEAEDESEAEDLVQPEADDYFFDQDSEQLVDDGLDEEGIFASIIRVEKFGPEHESWEYYLDPKQAEFYIKVNF